MASLCRSAVTAATRSVAARSKSLLPKAPSSPNPIPKSPSSSSTRAVPSAALRIASVMGSMESMLPLHSAIASARLRSKIAVDSTCWSWLSQDTKNADFPVY